MAVLPPGVSSEQFEAALREFRAAVGNEWVFTSEEDLHAYRDHFSYFKGMDIEPVPSAAVGPANVGEVQAIVRIANKYRIPLFTISTGKNFAYGGPSANLRGCVTLDLKRMNKIIEVDDKRHFAVVEPGVSYIDLYRYIQEKGLNVWIDTPDPGWGSPVGNSLDRGIGYTMGFYRDHFGAHCGMEVVLPSGELMRTGMGAMETANTWQDYRHGFGPDPAGLFAQGNFGVVVKMGFRLMPKPEHWRTGLITVPRRQDLIPLVETVNYLSDLSMIGEPWYGTPLRPLMASSDFASAVAKFDEGTIDRAAQREGLHSWQVELQCYGSEGTTKAVWEYAKQLIAKNVPGSKAIDGESLAVPLTKKQIEESGTPYESNMRRNVTQGVPGLGAWYMVGRTENNPNSWNEKHVGLISFVPRTGEGIFMAQRDFAEIAEMSGLSSPGAALSTPVCWYPFAFMMGAGFGATRDNAPSDRLEGLRILRKILIENAKRGYGDYRAPPMLQDDVSDQYGFNDHALRRFNEILKNAIDPNGIISPGRGGIWPKSFEKFRGTFKL